MNTPVVRREATALSRSVEDIYRTATPSSTARVAMIGAARTEAVTAISQATSPWPNRYAMPSAASGVRTFFPATLAMTGRLSEVTAARSRW
jgi:hypothetical protein